MSFRRGELAVSKCCVAFKSPSQEFSKNRMAVRGPPGSGPKEGATSPQARAAAYGDRLSQLEKDMAEMRDGTIKDVLEKLRLLLFVIKEINRRFGTVDHTGNTLDDLRARVDYYSNEMADLRRQVERGSASMPPQNQQAGTFPIPMYSGERNSLPRFLKLFYSWALSHRSEDALSYSRPVIMTSKKSRSELEGEYGRRDVERSLVVWSALTKAVEKDKTIADIVVGAKATSEAWKILKGMVEDDNSDRARELAKKQFEELSMNDDESMKAWALSHRSEDALSYSRPVIMTSKKSRSELEGEYGRRDVERSLVVWSALTKAVEKDKTIADIVVGAKATSEAWKILKGMVEDDNSDRARELAKKQFEELSMNDDESMKEYIARAKSLALNIKYHDVEITDQEISRRVLNGFPLSYAPEKRNFALKTGFSLAKLEGGLVHVEELNRSTDVTDGNHALAAGFKARSGERSGGRGGHNGGGRGKHDGKGCPPNQRQPQHQPRHQREQQPAHQPQQQQYQPRHQQQQQQYQPRHQREQQPANSSIISSGTSNISNRSRNSSTRGISRDIRSSPHSIQGNGVHHAFVSGVVNTGIFCRSAMQYPPRVFLTRTRARKLRLIYILKTTPILGVALHHHSQPPRRRTRMNRPFRPSHPGAPSANRPPWRNLRHQASLTYRMKAW